ncbi:MAG: BMC domain-containing protein [Deltaproteobacteria bacterium]|nr:BMC domain-containing protein [Deltaproteobacteria bacterium]
MRRLESIGLLELTSVGAGYLAQDASLKAADVELILGRTICAGKYLIVIGGDVAAVKSSVEAGSRAASGSVVEERVIPRVHPSVFPAIAMAVDLKPEELGALGILETFSAASIVEAADAIAKAANVTLLRMHLAMALGGKGFVLFTGDVASVEAGLAAGAEVAGSDGMLVSRIAIPAPRRELFQEFV